MLNSFAEVEQLLSSKRPDIKAVNWFFALEDMQWLMQGLGNPQEKPKVIHVAGTSGKTSTCYYLESLLRTANKHTGLTISPHIAEVNERVQIDGQPLSEAEFVEIFSEFVELPTVKAMNITYFGLLVAFAYWVFAKKQVDYAVIEVGMGGRLDATNVIENPDKVCVITDIGLDHTQFLGSTLSEIAREKAGIIHPNNHVFVAMQDAPIMAVFKEVCKQKNAHLHVMPNSYLAEAPSELPLFQKRNWSLARYAYEYVSNRDGLASPSTKQLQTSASISIPARMQTLLLANGRLLIMDVAHNAQKITALCEAIKQKYPGKRVTTLISMVEGKDSSLPDSLGALRTISGSIIITEFSGSQDVYRSAIDSNKLRVAAEEVGFDKMQVITNPVLAYEELLKQDTDIYLITGSFFLLNPLLPYLKETTNLQ